MRAKILILAICALALTSLLLGTRAMQNSGSVTLDLRDQGITDARDINIPNGTTRVFLSGNNFTNLADLVIPNSVRFLSLGLIGISDEDLPGLKLPNKLRTLLIGGNNLTDLRELDLPDSLVDFSAANNQIDSFDKLGNLPDSLEVLGISFNQITGGIFNSPSSLRLLGISDNPISKLTDLTLNNVDNLEVIDAIRTQITDISDIGSFSIPPKLKELNLGGNEIADISPIANATNLTGLIIGSDSLTSLDGVQLPPSLEFLQLTGNWTDMTGLIYNDKLRVLNIGGNQVSDLTKYNFPPGLKALSIASADNITDLSSLVLPEGLEVFDFSFLDLGDVSKFPTLPESIRKIDIQFNNLTSISGYQFPKNLRVIVADFNFLTDFDLKTLPKNSRLRRLSLRENRIDNKSRRARLRRRIRRRAPKVRANFSGRFSSEVSEELEIDFEFPD